MFWAGNPFLSVSLSTSIKSWVLLFGGLWLKHVYGRYMYNKDDFLLFPGIFFSYLDWIYLACFALLYVWF